MSARGRFLSGFVTMVIALAGLVTVGALPAAATDSRTVQYVALGDSYAAGQGAPLTSTTACKATRAIQGCLTLKCASICAPMKHALARESLM
jgi:hypothetical protein